jgi:hypothetical protein
LITANIVFSVFLPALRETPRGRLLGSCDLLVRLAAAPRVAEKQPRGSS